MKNSVYTFFLSLLMFSCQLNVEPPQAFGPIPTEEQLSWHEMEYFSLVCYGLNSYTEEEWAYGDVNPKLFNPSDLNTDQWAKVASEAGMKGLILVAKHHDGFCLWPSKLTDYSVAATPWKDGKGDVLGDLAKSCEKYGLKLGVYLSPWDRNHAEYGQPEYVDYYYEQLEELLTEYGDIFEFWIDGANGGTGHYGGANENRSIDRIAYYNYDKIFDIVKSHQPNAVIFSDVGPGCRWVGNESGIGGETNWNTIDREGRFPGDSDPNFLKYLQTGKKDAEAWVPAEVNTTLLWPKAWYHHTGHQPRSLANLMDLYYTSVGRGSPLNLGIAIAPSGKIRDVDARNLLKFKEQRDREFRVNLIEKANISVSDTRGNARQFGAKKLKDTDAGTYWASSDQVNEASIEMNFNSPVSFNRLLMQEYIALGQCIHTFKFEVEIDGKYQTITEGTTIGYKRLLRFPNVESKKARLSLKTDAPCLTLAEIGLFNAPLLVDDPVLIKGIDGTVFFRSVENVTTYFALGEKVDREEFKAYVHPLKLADGATIHYFAKENDGNYASEVITEHIGIARDKWKAVSGSESQKAIDGDNRSFALSKSGDIVIDMGKEINVSGFSYLPRQDGQKEGIIFDFEFYLSDNGRDWGKATHTGTFNNIENNPISRHIKLKEPTKARFIKLLAKSDVRRSGLASFADIQIFQRNN